MENSADELRERTKQFALRIIKLSRSLPSAPDAWVIGKQLLRSGTSVGANYRAACRARSHSEFVAKLCIVVEEADETAYWLELLKDSELVPLNRLRLLARECDELVAIFASARKTATNHPITQSPNHPI